LSFDILKKSNWKEKTYQSCIGIFFIIIWLLLFILSFIHHHMKFPMWLHINFINSNKKNIVTRNRIFLYQTKIYSYKSTEKIFLFSSITENTKFNKKYLDKYKNDKRQSNFLFFDSSKIIRKINFIFLFYIYLSNNLLALLILIFSFIYLISSSSSRMSSLKKDALYPFDIQITDTIYPTILLQINNTLTLE